jgi:septin family protein
MSIASEMLKAGSKTSDGIADQHTNAAQQILDAGQKGFRIPPHTLRDLLGYVAEGMAYKHGSELSRDEKAVARTVANNYPDLYATSTKAAKTALQQAPQRDEEWRREQRIRAAEEAARAAREELEAKKREPEEEERRRKQELEELEDRAKELEQNAEQVKQEVGNG